ncbi:hypothetical protein [Psychroflexus planctonicus]|uniref:Uncharacterized protein n=1 Tax=Psychroflexus planctonicus TaxID=1526575 RepID=A0ABQ1SHU1_9FLAO|nr:hypothetical protein [Psychroflexus planctonicus]GGE40354.1 hypothetical protein GCM10010832_20610 [Psychroflexus planctonicus]
MLLIKKYSYLILFFGLFAACSSDDDSDLNNDHPGGDDDVSETTFDISSSDREFGNAYLNLEKTEGGVDYYRLQILPPGVSFDSESAVFTGGSTGDYLSFDFKVSSSEEFLVSGDYTVGYQFDAFTVEGVAYSNVEIDLSSSDADPMVLTPEGSEGISLTIDENSFSMDVDIMAIETSNSGVEDVPITGTYSSSYEFIVFD